MEFSLMPEDAPRGLELRPLQKMLLDVIAQAFRDGHKNIMVCAPCGFGKTEIATAILIKTSGNNKRGAFICDRIQLIEQTGERFDRYNLEHGVMQASHWRYRPLEKIQLCSIQTLLRRQWPDAELTIHDEAHALTSAAKERLLQKRGFSIGLSATPMTKGLGKYFDIVITAATTDELVRQGLLVPFKIFAPSEPDMTGVKIKNGEYDDKESEAKCLPIVGDCVQEYLKYGDGKKFICFAVSVLHATELQAQFMSAGIVASLYTYREGEAERKAMVSEFRKPDSQIRGLISIESLSRGFDVTDVEVMICARPLRKALHVFIQMIGRVLRTHPGKTQALLLDHSGNSVRFYDDLMDYMENGVSELDDGEKKEKQKPEAKEKKSTKCPQCFHVHKSAPTCPNCGFEYQSKKSTTHEAGELKEIGGTVRASIEEKSVFYAMLKSFAQRMGYKPGFADMKFRERFGVWPNKYKDVEPIEPDQTVKNWIRSRQIAYAKAKKSA